jgi:hypothetical protein
MLRKRLNRNQHRSHIQFASCQPRVSSGGLHRAHLTSISVPNYASHEVEEYIQTADCSGALKHSSAGFGIKIKRFN